MPVFDKRRLVTSEGSLFPPFRLAGWGGQRRGVGTVPTAVGAALDILPCSVGSDKSPDLTWPLAFSFMKWG